MQLLIGTCLIIHRLKCIWHLSVCCRGEFVDNNEFVLLQKPAKDKVKEKKNYSWFDDNSCEIVTHSGQETQC